MENFEPKKEERFFQGTELEIHPADGVHGIGIQFDIQDENFVRALNVAILETCEGKGVFHQTGRGNDSGYHYWEFLGSNPSEQEVKEMFEDIYQKANDYYIKYKEMFDY